MSQHGMARGLVAAVIVGAFIVAAGWVVTARHSPAKSQQQQAQDWITKVGSDALLVQLTVQQVQSAAQDTGTSPSPDNIQALANLAQQAHDSLNAGISGYALGGSNGPVGDAILNIYGAVTDLKNAMGGIVAYTGDPNPATAAKMTSQYRSAVQEWDTAIDTIWTAAGQDNPPDL